MRYFHKKVVNAKKYFVSLSIINNQNINTMTEDEFKLAMEKFLLHLQSEPRDVKKDKLRNFEYIGVSEIEVLLDTLFFGLWQTEITQTIVVGNEIVMTGKLGVFHPIAKQWLWRAGSGSAMIRQTKGAAISDIDAKIKNGVEMDAPHAKASMIKNAAMSFGNIFGRNLRRKEEDISEYKPIHTPVILRKIENQQQLEAAAKRYLIEGNLDFVKSVKEVTPEQENQIIQLAKTLKNE